MLAEFEANLMSKYLEKRVTPSAREAEDIVGDMSSLETVKDSLIKSFRKTL